MKWPPQFAQNISIHRGIQTVCNSLLLIYTSELTRKYWVKRHFEQDFDEKAEVRYDRSFDEKAQEGQVLYLPQNSSPC